MNCNNCRDCVKAHPMSPFSNIPGVLCRRYNILVGDCVPVKHFCHSEKREQFMTEVTCYTGVLVFLGCLILLFLC